jgi:hypothetical protein
MPSLYIVPHSILSCLYLSEPLSWGSIICLCVTACVGTHETQFKYDKNFVVDFNINRQL